MRVEQQPLRRLGTPEDVAGGAVLVIQTTDTTRGIAMQELLVDFIPSLDGYGAAKGWHGCWGLEGPEHLGWLGQTPERDHTILTGANTYRLMSGFAAAYETSATGDSPNDEEASITELARASKVVFSSTLQPPLSWPNTQLVREDAVEAVKPMKQEGSRPMRTLGSLALCRSLLAARLVDRFRVVVFPVITASTGFGRIYDGYPDVALDMVSSRTFDGKIQLLEYVPGCWPEQPVHKLVPDQPGSDSRRVPSRSVGRCGPMRSTVWLASPAIAPLSQRQMKLLTVAFA